MPGVAHNNDDQRKPPTNQPTLSAKFIYSPCNEWKNENRQGSFNQLNPLI